MSMATSTVTIDLLNWAEGLAEMRASMARILREEAEADADPRVSRKLVAIAARFEAGQ
jgi:hypothetical protein